MPVSHYYGYKVGECLNLDRFWGRKVRLCKFTQGCVIQPPTCGILTMGGAWRWLQKFVDVGGIGSRFTVRNGSQDGCIFSVKSAPRSTGLRLRSLVSAPPSQPLQGTRSGRHRRPSRMPELLLGWRQGSRSAMPPK